MRGVGGMLARTTVSIALLFAVPSTAVLAVPDTAQRLGRFAIDPTEVTIGEFRAYRDSRSLVTAAEHAGGGFEFGSGWERRSGWTWSSPYGKPGLDNEPVVHVSWREARDFCLARGGRLPTLDEWRRTAFTETRTEPTDNFVNGRTYPYPVGDKPEGMNTSANDPWPRHAAVGETRRGVNGLYDMGGNVWEWLADQQGDQALTAGGSWWYGADKTQASGVQWKPAEFYAVYVGFRCAYDL
jgi:formylglycine-generating enzyme